MEITLKDVRDTTVDMIADVRVMMEKHMKVDVKEVEDKEVTEETAVVELMDKIVE